LQEDEVLGRIRSSVDNPLDLEAAGHALFDMLPERRGNLFGDEVYRLTKAPDAATSYPRPPFRDDPSGDDAPRESPSTGPASGKPDASRKSDRFARASRYLPPNHKFSPNDVVAITLQPRGSGDFFGPSAIPAGDGAASVEARVLGLGPTYVDVALRAGTFEAALGPAPNDYHHRSAGANANASAATLRVRADRFVSRVPYERMVAALCQTTNVPGRSKTTDAMRVSGGAPEDASPAAAPAYDNIHMDEVLREAILSTHALADPSNSPLHRDIDSAYDLEELVRRPPWASPVFGGFDASVCEFRVDNKNSHLFCCLV
jgi:hypothetical protein